MPTSLPHASDDYKTHGPNRVPTFSASADPRSPETLGLWARNGAHVPANCGTPVAGPRRTARASGAGVRDGRAEGWGARVPRPARPPRAEVRVRVRAPQ